MNRLDQVN
jgi:hypothetical protein